MSTSPSSPYLEIFLGPMFSGKTSKLFELYKKYNSIGIPTLIINHSLDDRYDNPKMSAKTDANNTHMMSTHNLEKVSCRNGRTLSEIWDQEENKTPTVILINEGQFFEDLYEVVLDMLKCNKTVYVSGLDGDFKQRKIGSILDIIPLCDKVTKLSSLCVSCKNGTPAIFSKRITDESEQILIGSTNYIAVCRKCILDCAI